LIEAGLLDVLEQQGIGCIVIFPLVQCLVEIPITPKDFPRAAANRVQLLMALNTCNEASLIDGPALLFPVFAHLEPAPLNRKPTQIAPRRC
jgi:hypothetical protein